MADAHENDKDPKPAPAKRADEADEREPEPGTMEAVEALPVNTDAEARSANDVGRVEDDYVPGDGPAVP